MNDGTVVLYDAQTMKETKRIAGHNSTVYAAKISPDGSKLLSCSRDTTIRVLELSSGKELWHVNSSGEGLADADWSPDGTQVAFCSWYRKEGVRGIVSLSDDKRLYANSSGSEIAVFEASGFSSPKTH